LQKPFCVLRTVCMSEHSACMVQDEKAYWAGKRGCKTDLPRGKKTTRSKKH